MKMNKATIAKAMTRKKNDKGFSLPSVIVGSIIAAILGTVAIGNMWSSVDKASISAEKSTISNLGTAAAGILEENGSFPSALDATIDATALSKINKLPKELKYQFVLMEGATTSTSDNFIALKAYAADAKGKDKLLTITAELDQQYDGTTAGAETPTAGKFVYVTTCSDPATAATSQTDCFYVTPVLGKSTIPTDLGDGTGIEGVVAGGTNDTNGYDTVTAAGVTANLN